MISAKDINNKRFEQARPGYKPEEVDEFLRDIALQITQMQKEKEETEKKIEVLVESVREYKKDEDALKDALIGAQKQGRAVVQEAQEKADRIIADANVKAQEILGSTKSQLEREKQCLSKMQQEVSDFKANLLAMYKAHLEQITSIPDFEDDEAEEEIAEETPVQAAPEQPKQPEVQPEVKPEPQPAAQNMEATRVMDNSFKRDKQAQAFPFGDTSTASSESKFGNLKFGQHK
ncbi:MAG: DivIVA domain-containing protein [Oscillospiraceae bacterium]